MTAWVDSAVPGFVVGLDNVDLLSYALDLPLAYDGPEIRETQCELDVTTVRTIPAVALLALTEAECSG